MVRTDRGLVPPLRLVLLLVRAQHIIENPVVVKLQQRPAWTTAARAAAVHLTVEVERVDRVGGQPGGGHRVDRDGTFGTHRASSFNSSMPSTWTLRSNI